MAGAPFERGALLLLSALLACGPERPPDAEVAALDYTPRTLQQIKRRMHLTGAGVPLRGALAAAKIWRNAAGYTFIARAPAGDEYGIRTARPHRMGVLSRDEPLGLAGKRRGVHTLAEDYWIVDLFDDRDEYLHSAAAPRAMSGRRILQHLGLARPLSPTADRFFLSPAQQLHWRDLLPLVLANRGFGMLFTRPSTDATAPPDSLKVHGRYYAIEKTAGYVLVGQHRGTERYRHVFTAGGDYLASIHQYAPAPFDPIAALRLLGIAPTDTTFQRISPHTPPEDTKKRGAD